MSTQTSDDNFIIEALPAFISEANEQIAMLEQLLLQLEDEPGNRDLLDALFRCAHTVKGSAGIFGLDPVVAFTHHVETLLDRLRENLVSLTPQLSTLLLQCNDQIRLLVAGAAGDQQDDAESLQLRQTLVERLHAAGGTGDAPAACHDQPGTPAAPHAAVPPLATARWQITVQFGVDTYRNGLDPLSVLNYVRGLGTIPRLVCDMQAVPALDPVDPESCHLAFNFDLDTDASREQIDSAFSFVRDDCLLLRIEPQDGDQAPDATPDAAMTAAGPPPVTDGTRATTAGNAPKPTRPREAAGTPPAAEENRYIRVPADRLDEVINLLGELVIAGAGASLLARNSGQSALIEANQQITRLIEEIRNGTLQLRMVPIGETFSRFRRVVRDTASELGKDVALEIIGGDTELDKSVVEQIADPLMHLVRNALDHGLETPEQRQAAGKPPQGKLTLSACHESGGILIRIIDNGRGIQRHKVLQQAWDRGLVDPGHTPSDADILKLIFEPGFSTADKVTSLSGRGVGMDVVRRNIEALRGSVTIASEPGLGSSMAIRLPLTLAIIDGFLISVGPSKFIFPLEAVVEVIETRPTSAPLDPRGRGIIELRGQTLPLVDLRTLYALDSPAPERRSVVVVQSGSRHYGVLLDALLGQHQTVIKPLGRMFRSLRGISGSSILGTGEVALIIDVNSLGELAAADLHGHATAMARQS